MCKINYVSRPENIYDFEYGYEMLRLYISVYGKTHFLPRDCVFCDFPIGLWLHHNILLASKSARKKAAFSLLGIETNRHEGSFLTYCDLLKDYKKEFGHLVINSSLIYKNHNLGSWCHNIRENQKYLPEGRYHILSDLGFIWNYADAKFENNLLLSFNLLRQYGSLPRNYKHDSINIGEWFYNLLAGRCKITKSKFDILSKYNYSWIAEPGLTLAEKQRKCMNFFLPEPVSEPTLKEPSFSVCDDELIEIIDAHDLDAQRHTSQKPFSFYLWRIEKMNKYDASDLEFCINYLNSSTERKRILKIYVRKLMDYTHQHFTDITHKDAMSFTEHLYKEIESQNLKPLYVKQVLMGLKTFYSHLISLSDSGLIQPDIPCIKMGNPFAQIKISIPDKIQYYESDFPTLQDIEFLVSTVKCKDPDLSLAICLAFNMCLKTKEIINLTIDNLIEDKFETMYIVLDAIDENGKTKRYLPVPAPIVPQFREILRYRNSIKPYIILSRVAKKKYTQRNIEIALKNFVKSNPDITFPITFESLRITGIKNLIDSGTPYELVSKYAGIEGRWLSRFDNVPPLLVADPSAYQNIIIK